MPITTDKRETIGLDPVTVDWSKVEGHPDYNPKEVPEGSVVYYIRKKDNRYYVDYGIVYQHYADCVLIQKLTPRDRRLVVSAFSRKPIPFSEFPYNTEWRKLPKGWSWDTRMFEIVDAPMEDEEAAYKLDLENPATIIEAYNRGYLVNVRDVPYEKIDAVIEKANGYKLTRKSKEDLYKQPDTVGIDFHQCFASYAEAKQACDKAEAELAAQSEMTDEEWSVSLIDHDLDRWQKLYSISEENKRRAREFLMNRERVEDLETRIVSGGIQFKYWKNTKWMNIPVE